MALQDIALAMQRTERVLRRRPEIGIHDDAPATARWDGGTRIVASHHNGMQVTTDMPSDIGGSGDQVTPGWMFRASIASCAATCIAMAAAARGIELKSLELLATSRSDTRGLLGMSDDDGEPVNAALDDLQLHVRISAPGVSPESLRALVEEGYRFSPVPCAVQQSPRIDLRIDVAED